ncbi:hypothetical protein OIU77_004914 [Salix suchowensis]|uniref:Uncharacterized protein n=1 Tax=Salix suchowensis TaxID=1278906 RepID=A0ABQ9AXM5_9ROSI|nr:hypothetical protein OIU77_004914 [Salix suchowensis]
MARLQLTNQVPAEKTWQESIKIDIAKLNPLSNWSIWRVPNNLLAVNKDAYGPHIISIGPLHHGEQSVVAMEVHKLHYMLSLLARTPDRAKSLDECGKAILRFDKHIRACYAEPIDKYSENDLAKMLLVDGCFILELFLRFSMADLRLQDDPVFNTTWMVLTLRRDLALLENQIPFFVLEWLFKLTVKPSAIGQSLPSLPELAFDFFKQALYIDKETLDVSRRTVPHLLGLIHNSYLPYSSRPNPRGRGGWEFINCASVLHETGIEFERDATTNPFDLKFEKGVFKIPPLRIHDSTVSLFQNLIAYEQRFHGSHQYITSYFLLMDRLIDTPDCFAGLLLCRAVRGCECIL